MFTTSDTEIIDKAYILSRVTQEDIFQYYMGRPVELRFRFTSPVRADKHPTCTMRYINGKLLYRDWSLPRAEDCFAFVMTYFGCSYTEALEQIAADLKLSDREPTGRLPAYITSTSEVQRKSDKKIIQVKVQPFQQAEADYLKSYHLTPNQTTKFRVFSPRYVWLEGRSTYIYRPDDPALAYYFGQGDDGHQRWKIYFYKRRRTHRFLGNTNRIQGWIQLPKRGDVCVITKSLKDVMVFDRFGIPAIAMQSETTFPYDYIIEELKERFTHLFTLYDFDAAGIAGALKIRRAYGIQPLFLTDGRFGTVDYQAKDISDLIHNHGPVQTMSLLRYTAESLSLKTEIHWHVP